MKITDWGNILRFLETLMEEYRIIAPTDERGRVNFNRIESVSEVVADFCNTRSSPKGFFIQDSVPVFSTGNYLEDMDGLRFEIDGKSLIFGLRACDIGALSLLDQLYFKGLLGQGYERNRRRTLIVGMNCSWPGNSCFCTTFGKGPLIEAGADIVLTDLGNLYFVEALSNGGKRVLDRFPGLFMDAKAEHRKRKEGVMEEAEGFINDVNVNGIGNKLKFMTQRYWDKLGERCIGCYSCDIVCPTTPSFGNGMENPKKRAHHKLDHVRESYGEFGCVGCGRCIDICPRSIGMANIIEDINGMWTII